MNIEKDNLSQVSIDFTRGETVHFHEALELLFLLEGRLRVEVEKDVWEMEKNDVLVVNSGMKHSISPVGNESILFQIKISRALISRQIDNPLFLIWCNSIVDKADYDDIRRTLKAMIRHYMHRGRTDLYFQGELYQLLYYLVENYLITSDDRRYKERVSKTDERVLQILSYIHENYNRDITLTELAGQLYLTNAYLSRFFKKTMGVNFGEYVNNIKLHYAVEDLLYTSKSITRIAMDNGFSNMATFNKSFREMYHMTPSVYKETMNPGKQERQYGRAEQKRRLARSLTRYLDGENTDTPRENGENLDIRADVLKRRDNKQPWRPLMNVGQLSCLRDYRIRSELLRLNSSLKFTYVRFWNVLSDDMALGRYISDNLLDYNFTYLDDYVDFLVQNRLKPYFQMGYKEARYTYGGADDDGFTRVDHFFSFKTRDELLSVLRLMLRHLLLRYGKEEVSTWRFEIWYPHIYYVLPEFCVAGGKERLSIEIYRVLREMVPEAKIGGAEFCFLTESDKIYDRLLIYKEAGVVPDFITCVSFPYKLSPYDDHIAKQWQVDDNFILNEIRNLRSILEHMGWGGLPIWLTEYSFTVIHRNPLNDSRFKGAWLLKNMSDMAPLVDAAGYWLLSDIYSEGIDSNRLLYGGSGLVTKDGIYKPAYYALYFLTQMKPQLIDKGPNYLMTTDGNHTYTLLLYHMKSLNHRAFMKTEADMTVEDLSLIFEDEAPLNLKLTVNNIDRGIYRIKRLNIDDDHGDIQNWTLKNYMAPSLKRSEIWHLQQTCMPGMEISEKTIREGQPLILRESIEANCFIFYEIEMLH